VFHITNTLSSGISPKYSIAIREVVFLVNFFLGSYNSSFVFAEAITFASSIYGKSIVRAESGMRRCGSLVESKVQSVRQPLFPGESHSSVSHIALPVRVVLHKKNSCSI